MTQIFHYLSDIHNYKKIYFSSTSWKVLFMKEVSNLLVKVALLVDVYTCNHMFDMKNLDQKYFHKFELSLKFSLSDRNLWLDSSLVYRSISSEMSE